MAIQKRNLRTKLKKTVGISLVLIFLASCSWTGRTIYVPHGDAVRLRETVKDVKVWIKSSTGEIVPGKMDLPEGWYCLPLEDE